MATRPPTDPDAAREDLRPQFIASALDAAVDAVGEITSQQPNWVKIFALASFAQMMLHMSDRMPVILADTDTDADAEPPNPGP